MRQASMRPAGHPGSALLILGAIFAIALFLRVPIRTPEKPGPIAIDATNLSVWTLLPIAMMERPAPGIVSYDTPRIAAMTASAAPEPIQHGVPAVLPMEAARTDPHPPRPGIVNQPSATAPAPVLVATAQNPLSELAAPVAPESYVESSSGPFGAVGGAVGTAFVKTGVAISTAFKKTGQGILAPF